MAFISTEKKEGVLVVRMTRADKFNSFNREMALELQAALKSAADDASVRAVLLTGEGKAFCAGQDLAEAINPDGPGIKKIVVEHYNPIILAIRNLQKPVIAAVNGVAAGAGANIALACDIIYAGASASFIQAFSKIGLVPDSGGTFTLPRIVGPHLAAALMMTGDKLSAEDAKGLGLVYKVFPDEDLFAHTLAAATNLSLMPTKALWQTKQLLNATYNNTLEQQLQLEGDLQVEAAQSADYKEGVQAFLEKRKPVFNGN
jgi:2-(1,2-epoxy-1,2-dihydrophenyl)acetyl-CoA isomerase